MSLNAESSGEVHHLSPQESEVNGLYQAVLGRDADPGGLQSYVSELQHGSSAGVIRRTLATSDENRARIREMAEKDRGGAVAYLYTSILGREIDPSGRETYADSETLPIDTVIDRLVDSEEFRDRFLEPEEDEQVVVEHEDRPFELPRTVEALVRGFPPALLLEADPPDRSTDADENYRAWRSLEDARNKLLYSLASNIPHEELVRHKDSFIKEEWRNPYGDDRVRNFYSMIYNLNDNLSGLRYMAGLQELVQSDPSNLAQLLDIPLMRSLKSVSDTSRKRSYDIDGHTIRSVAGHLCARIHQESGMKHVGVGGTPWPMYFLYAGITDEVRNAAAAQGGIDQVTDSQIVEIAQRFIADAEEYQNQFVLNEVVDWQIRQNQEAERREQLLNAIVDQGRSRLYTGVPTGGQGTVEQDGVRHQNRGMIFPTHVAFDRQEEGSLVEQLHDQQVIEMAVIAPLTERVRKQPSRRERGGRLWDGRLTRSAPPPSVSTDEAFEVRRPSLREAIGTASDEPAYVLSYQSQPKHDTQDPFAQLYTDMHNRPSNGLTVEIVLPLSLAEQLASVIHKEPQILRRLTEKFVKERYKQNFQSVWDTSRDEQTHGVGRPPWEEWDALRGGAMKLFFADMIRHPEKVRAEDARLYVITKESQAA